MRSTPLILKLLPAILGTVVVALMLVLATRAEAAGLRSEFASLEDEAISFVANSGDEVEAYSGGLLVPENRDDPDSKLIALRYVRFPATDNASGPPIVYLSGGPGGSGIATARWRRFPLFMAMRAFGDVIALDQRGTGESDQPPECESSVVVPTEQVIDDNHFARLYRQAVEECTVFWKAGGTDLRGYTTRDSVADLSALRRHLGADRISLWGISYGSHLALAAMKTIPDQIDRVMLASVEGLDQTVKLPSRTDAYLTRISEALGAENLPSTIRKVHQQLLEEPVLLQLDAKDGSRTPYLLQRRDLQMMSSSAIADPQWASKIIALYESAAAGDWEPARGLLQRFAVPGEPIRLRAMPLAMDRASGISNERKLQVQREATSSLLGAYLNFPMPQIASLLGDLDLGDDFRQDPVSDIPTLVLTGTLDGRTYPEAQREATAGLTHARHVTVAGAGHNLFMASPQVQEVMEDFMANRPPRVAMIQVSLP